MGAAFRCDADRLGGRINVDAEDFEPREVGKGLFGREAKAQCSSSEGEDSNGQQRQRWCLGGNGSKRVVQVVVDWPRLG